MLGLDPSIQVNNIANFNTWILRSSRRMTERGEALQSNPRVTVKEKSSPRGQKKGEVKLENGSITNKKNKPRFCGVCL